MADTAGGAPAEAPEESHHSRKQGLLALAVGSVGVVFGDIGTSPLYSMREALSHSRHGPSDSAVMGVVSLIFWALIIVVTIKYVIFVMRADNKGEGGTLALMALAQRALGHRSTTIFMLGVCGAALFYGDGLITPAVSVLSAVELLKNAPSVGHLFTLPVILVSAAAILVGLFLVQSRGTANVGRFFGPVMVVWFLVLGGLGVYHIVEAPRVLMALNPYYGLHMLAANGLLGFVILGSVFLAVTGAEALYADMGHFGRTPIRLAWLVLALPCLTLQYFGQGAMVLAHPEAAKDPFFAIIPHVAYWPVLILTIVATVIASQAVITGAYSMTQQAVQLGLLPRIDIRRTSETVAGQIFVPSVNRMLMIGVLVLLVLFQTSDNMASAYGIAVTGTMVITVLLEFIVARRFWKWSLAGTLAFVAPLLFIDLSFLGANLVKVLDGGWFPLSFGAALVLIMWTWTRGAQILTDKTRRDSVPLLDLSEILRSRATLRVPGTAIFLTSDPETAPVALMHNLKHNKVLHEKNIVLTIETAETPRVGDDNRIRIEPVNDDFKKIFVSYGFMESPNLPKALGLCRRLGLKFDIMATSFFLGRRSVVPSAQSGMPLWQDRLFIFLMKNAANPTDFYKIPPGRVVELGAQVTV
ncbi:potassium transporter Kup [Phenylobacterium sp.]|uniref:potassium transporter Kup n=1 Tax=Phenylobacterium sp. TaxID=1871053 RepID=UPI00120C6C86|nr:potassium transporter Kup [Phenylobacterium sp.]THD57895.1 MAG: potassium transporter Kup [Phenylobacterium sp.]